MSSVLVALRRLRDDRAPAIGLGLLVLVTATVFGLAPRLLDRVADDAFRGVAAAASAFNRNISLVEETTLPSKPGQPLAGVDEEGSRQYARFPASIQGLIGDRQVVVDSPRWHIEAKTADPSFVRFRLQPGAASRVRYVTGGPPTAATRLVDLPADLRRLLPPDESGTTEPVKVTVLQAAISADAAHEVDLAAGQVLFLSLDGRDPLAGRRMGVAAIEITGIFEVTDPADPFWYEDRTLERVGIRTLGGDSRLLDIGALVADDAYDPLIQSVQVHGAPVRYTWRYFVGPELLRASQLDTLIRDLRRLETTYPQTQVSNFALEGTAMRSGLLPLVQAHAARWASALAILTVVAIGPAAVAVAALALVATIAARRRRPAIALVRGRGATIGQILRAIFLEGMVISIPALAAAILLAIVLVPADSNRPTILAATTVAVLAMALLIATALPGTAAVIRSTRDGDAPHGVSARRLVLDIVVIGLAAGGAYLLRERGVRGTSSTGTLTGADPLIAAVPALAGIAAGLSAIRLVPLPLRLLGRIAAAGRGFVPLLAFRRAIHGGTTGAVLIVLLAAASIGAFSSAALVHLDRAGQASSWHDVGAPFRITAQIGSISADLDPSKLPGVTAAASLFRTLVPVGTRNLRIQLLAVDAAAYDAMVRGTPADPGFPPEMLGPGGDVVPLLISSSLAGRSDGVAPGQQFELVVEGYHYQVKAIAVRDTFPTLATDAIFAVASRQQLQAVHRDAQLSPTSIFVAAPDGDGQAIRDAATTVTAAATVDGRAEESRVFTDSPVTAAIVAGIVIAAVIAAIYAALAVTAALALAGAARAVEVAHLRTLGLSRGEALGLAIIEHGPTVIFAFVAGVALGLGLFVLLEPGLGLDAIVGSQIEVPLSTDPRQLAIILAAVLVIAAVGIGLAAWMQRRGAPVAALRRGFE